MALALGFAMDGIAADVQLAGLTPRTAGLSRTLSLRLREGAGQR